jgi:hypothetical protein
MPSRNRDEQNPPGNTLPEDSEEETTTTEPDAAATLTQGPTPDVTVNPRIKNT